MNPFKFLFDKPWQHDARTLTGVAHGHGVMMVPAQKTALILFLIVVAILFGLFIVAYLIRMDLDDWRPMPESGLLWFNTLLLFLSSVVLQWSRSAVRGQPSKTFKMGLFVGALLTLGFVYGQLVVWDQMFSDGYYLYNNPANSFFYILTGIHGLHILGGLWVWTRVTMKVWSGAEPEEVRLSVELCAIYWHFLLLVWLVVFGLLSYS